MEVPKGKIVAIGGNEKKGNESVSEGIVHHQNAVDEGILKRIHDELHGLGTRIEVVTSATITPEAAGQIYTDAFLLLGCDNVGVLPIQQPEDTKRPDFLERLRKADAVMFTGGDQCRIIPIFENSEALHILKTRYQQEDKFLISGTSAGAMALSRIMISGSLQTDPLIKGTVELAPGLGILDHVIIDTHFVNRRRIPRLIEAIAGHPTHIGIGLGEDTGIMITENNCIETIGSGLVVVIDGRKLEENNYNSIEKGQALCVENLIMHVLPKGRSYHIPSGEFM
ncbi:cyanophycinase [Pontibacter sp. KCTC 32443]|uniref:cyanophycinase n=1 Tax=Pontibacter TaxID=323449 RepID=UPI00164E04FD|nr:MULTISPECIES: cyanophycinase [Pontibacter]MBC5772705.1 cyanophycinase [Pontibacter sp. KCTC 32443]